jgi:hypothetical protein
VTGDRPLLAGCCHRTGQRKVAAVGEFEKPRHGLFWKNPAEKSERQQLVVVAEPYRLEPRTLREYLELAFEVSNRYALWHPPETTAALWHCSGERWWETEHQLVAA